MGIKKKVTVIEAYSYSDSGKVYVDVMNGQFAISLTPKEATKFAKQLNKAITRAQGTDEGVVNE